MLPKTKSDSTILRQCPIALESATLSSNRKRALTVSPCWRNTSPKRLSPHATPDLCPTSLQIAMPSSSSMCTLAESTLERKSTCANPKSDQAMPSTSPTCLQSAKLSSLSKMALAYSTCWLTISAKLLSDQAIPCLSSTSLKSVRLSLLSEMALAYSPCWLMISAKLLSDQAIPCLSPTSR